MNKILKLGALFGLWFCAIWARICHSVLVRLLCGVPPPPQRSHNTREGVLRRCENTLSILHSCNLDRLPSRHLYCLFAFLDYAAAQRRMPHEDSRESYVAHFGLCDLPIRQRSIGASDTEVRDDKSVWHSLFSSLVFYLESNSTRRAISRYANRRLRILRVLVVCRRWTALSHKSVGDGLGYTDSASVSSYRTLCKLSVSALFVTMLLFYCIPSQAATWFIRTDGGTRYSSNVTTGQCNGKSDSAYPGTGVNQNCAFNDFRYMWDDDSGLVGQGAWVSSAGDTIVIRGCHASANQTNPANPTCRIGWDQPTGACSGGVGTNCFCYAVGSYTCYNPTVPSNTTILGACAYLTNTCNPVVGYPYTSNLTQLFGGFSLSSTFNLTGSSGVTIQGIELTTHNKHWTGSTWSGNCTIGTGSPAYPVGCANNQPLDDYAQNGFLTNATTTNLTMIDVYVHGFDSAGFFGPIGAGMIYTRVQSDFNAFAGLNFDDGGDDPDGTGATIAASYFTTEGNGCYEQFPIVNTSWPARACYDPSSSGFGDAWSGQDTTLASFSCDHCVSIYNTKDAFIGPHTQIVNLSITNSVSIGNMGAAWKWGGAPNATVLFQNNLTVTNCLRQTEILPGAAQNFNISTTLGGSYLSNFCRGGGAGFANVMRSGSTLKFYGSTVVGLGSIGYQVACGYYSVGNVFNPETTCNTSTTSWIDNNLLGYTDAGAGSPTALFCLLNTDGSTCTLSSNSGIALTNSFNNEYGWRSGTTDTCTGNITCVSPLLVNQPAETFPGTQTDFDVFNPFVSNNSFYPTGSSPLIGAGTTLAGLGADYYGTTRPSPPTIGGVEPAGAPPSSPGVGISGRVVSSGTVTIP